jgi:hypothetical protein
MRERRQADGAAYHGVLGTQQHRAALLPCTLEVAAPTAERQQRTCWYADSPHAQQRSGAIGLHRRIAFISPVHTPDRKPQISRLRRMRPALSGTAAIRNGGTEGRNQVLSWASLSLPVSVCRPLALSPQALSPQAPVPRYGCWLLAAGVVWVGHLAT